MRTSARHCQFIDQGVILHEPDSVTLNVSPAQIGAGTEIFPGCRISGTDTSIAPGCRIGEETPATLINCQFGRHVNFAGGFARDAVFLEGASAGSGAHIRPGTLLEEQATCAHSVGLKQTLLMPYVTLGSLINFCDCLIAGGTGPTHHSEVGSACIHFNFTPHQDKATPSLLGDVPRGVMLDQPPVFIGGQGGLVGPVRIAYGTVLAAGTICRRDICDEGMLVYGPSGSRQKQSTYQLHQYGDIDRIGRNNFIFVGNLHALAAWYQQVRPLLTPSDPFAQACLHGAQRLLSAAVIERISRFAGLAAKLATAPGPYASHRRLLALRPRLDSIMRLPPESPAPPPAELIRAIHESRKPAYIDTIHSLPASAKRAGTRWLQGIADVVAQHWEAPES